MSELKIGEIKIPVVIADVPHGTVLLVGRVEPDEILPGESVGEALVRLKRAVAIKE